jgi:hypothetical protein
MRRWAQPPFSALGVLQCRWPRQPESTDVSQAMAGAVTQSQAAY